MQTLADALKFIFKEIIIPAGANKVIFVLAPIITLTLALIAWAVIPVCDEMMLEYYIYLQFHREVYMEL